LKKTLKLVAIAMCMLAVPQLTYIAKPVSATQTTTTTATTVGTVTANPSLNLRMMAVDVATSTILASIPKNTQVTIFSKNANNWYNVKYNGQTGWVSGQYLSLEPLPVTTTPESDVTTKTVAASSGLNLRKTDVTTSEVLTTIPNNTQVVVISKNESNWCNVTYNGQTGWVSGSYLTDKTVAVAVAVTAPAPVVIKAKSVSRSESPGLINRALSLQGIPYVFGGTKLSGFDCSGYTQYVFKQSGISLPRIAADQFKMGSQVSREQLRPGDLLFFTTYAPGASHVGIYIGGGRFVAACNNGVSISTLDSSYYASRYLGARRVS
jgi:cell wall-associated NlpC family hydrolase